MANKRFTEIDIATGRFLGGWIGPEALAPEPPAGRQILVSDDLTSPWPPAGSTWNGNAFVAPPPIARRVITLREFLQRCEIPERIAFNAMRAADPTAEVLWAELLADTVVRLDDPTLIAGLAMVKAANAANGYQIWPDDATADARIAAIRA